MIIPFTDHGIASSWSHSSRLLCWKTSLLVEAATLVYDVLLGLALMCLYREEVL